MKEKNQKLLTAVLVTGASVAISPTQNLQSYQATLAATTTPTATVLIEGSNDGVNWVTLATLSPSSSGDSVGATVESAWVKTRANCTAIAGVSAAVTVTVAY